MEQKKLADGKDPVMAQEKNGCAGTSCLGPNGNPVTCHYEACPLFHKRNFLTTGGDEEDEK